MAAAATMASLLGATSGRSRCGLPAGPDQHNPPAPPHVEPYKTHLAYVKERRSDAEAAEILAEALELLRSRRKSGDIIF